MDRYCPECNSNMTPSLVGYLCVNCGHMQRFYTGEATLKLKPTASSSQEPSKSHTHHSTTHTIKTDDKPKNKVKHTLKRLMVPELMPPHSHLIGENDANIKPVMAERIEEPSPTPAVSPDTENNFNTAYNANDPTDSIDSPAETAPNQSSNLTELQAALHPQKNTSIWVMLGIAVLMLVVAAALLFLIILS